MKIPIKKLTHDAKTPTRGTSGSAGYDLYASEDVELYSFGIVPTGVSVAIPEGYYGRIAPRSGLAAKHGVDVLGGVIDSDYRGEIKVILDYHHARPFPLPFSIPKGTRIAQLIIEACYPAEFVEFNDLDLPSTVRGEKGFGSTGTGEPILEGQRGEGKL